MSIVACTFQITRQTRSDALSIEIVGKGVRHDGVALHTYTRWDAVGMPTVCQQFTAPKGIGSHSVHTLHHPLRISVADIRVRTFHTAASTAKTYAISRDYRTRRGIFRQQLHTVFFCLPGVEEEMSEIHPCLIAYLLIDAKMRGLPSMVDYVVNIVGTGRKGSIADIDSIASRLRNLRTPNRPCSRTAARQT